MREIKFRAYYQKVTNDKWIIEGEYTMADLTDKGILFDQVRIKWVQFTGLKDKHSKEIYEGDLLNEIRYPPDKDGNYDSVPVFIKDNIIQVGFNEGYFTAGGTAGGRAHLWRFISNINDGGKTDYEIIGNIHENPELCATR